MLSLPLPKMSPRMLVEELVSSGWLEDAFGAGAGAKRSVEIPLLAPGAASNGSAASDSKGSLGCRATFLGFLAFLGFFLGAGASANGSSSKEAEKGSFCFGLGLSLNGSSSKSASKGSTSDDFALEEDFLARCSASEEPEESAHFFGQS